jgi:hypothetical protein
MAPGSRFAGRLFAVSVSDTEDLQQLGLPPDQMDQVLQAVLPPLVAEGASIAYGGRIDHPHNFTLVISTQLGEAYRRLEQSPGKRPFIHFIAQHRWLGTAPEAIAAHLQRLAPYGEIWVTGEKGVIGSFAAATAQGQEMAAGLGCGLQAASALEVVDNAPSLAATAAFRAVAADATPDAALSFTHMRREMARRCDARVQVGGRKSGFAGAISGLCEEALLSIETRKPLLVLGGFGGAARDIAAALGLIDAASCVPRTPAADEDRYQAGLRQLGDARPAYEALFDADQLRALKALAATDSLPEAATRVAGLLGSVCR